MAPRGQQAITTNVDEEQTKPEKVIALMQGSRFGVPAKLENKNRRAVTPTLHDRYGISTQAIAQQIKGWG